MKDARNETRIAVILAAADERPAMQPALDLLDRLGIEWMIEITPAWAMAERVADWGEHCARHGIKVLLVVAGTEPYLPALIAATCTVPIVAVPLTETASPQTPATLHLPYGSTLAPVAVVLPDDAEQAAMLAARMLAMADLAIADVIEQYRQEMLQELEGQNRDLTPPSKPIRDTKSTPSKPAPKPKEPAPEYAESDEGPVEVRPANFDRPLTGAPIHAAAERPAAPPASGPSRGLGRRRIDPEAPAVELIEDAVDCLLEGGVIAFPTDTVYGVAVDATNRAAVERLFELKGRPRNKAVTLLVDSPRLLAGIACNLTVESRRLMEAFWPGPLTIIFQKRGGNFAHVSETETIGVRLPDHSVPLSIMQALARPLACTSANLTGQPETLSAEEVERYLGAGLDLILDGGRLPESPPSTVIDVTREPYRILRLGALTHEQLAAIVGDKLEPEG